MLERTSLPADPVALSRDNGSWSSNRFRWRGSGFAVVMLIVMSGSVPLILAPNASAKPPGPVPAAAIAYREHQTHWHSKPAFTPSLPVLGLEGNRLSSSGRHAVVGLGAQQLDRRSSRKGQTQLNWAVQQERQKVQKQTAFGSTQPTAQGSAVDQVASYRTQSEMEDDMAYELRRNEWLARFGSFEAVQSTYGKGTLWGDLDSLQARILRHALLTRALLALNEMGLMRRDELALLAYQARMAVSAYAQSRTRVSDIYWISLYHNFKMLQGKWWDTTPVHISLRPEGRIMLEEYAWARAAVPVKGKMLFNHVVAQNIVLEQDDTLTMRIYARLLERSCGNDQAYASLFFISPFGGQRDLAAVAAQLENEIKLFLQCPENSALMNRSNYS